MEIRRGKGNLERLVNQWREDEENKKWVQSRTTACAECGVRVEKRYVFSARYMDCKLIWLSHGCNHMSCARCNSHFCFRCGEAVSHAFRLDPPSHRQLI